MQSTQASPKLVHAREQLVRRIEGAIQRAYGSRYTVEVFGSSRYGMDKGDSDLDLVICVRAIHPILMMYLCLLGLDRIQIYPLDSRLGFVKGFRVCLERLDRIRSTNLP